VDDDRHRLIWRIGKGFPSRDLELSLEARLRFDGSKPALHDNTGLCRGTTTYVDLSFRLPGSTLSAMTVLPASVKVRRRRPGSRPTVQQRCGQQSGALCDDVGSALQVQPAAALKSKASLQTSLASGCYRVWNLLGDVHACVTSPHDLLGPVVGQ